MTKKKKKMEKIDKKKIKKKKTNELDLVVGVKREEE